MSQISCGVTSCKHYCDQGCCKNQIEVGGHAAETSRDTCCDSFSMRAGGYSNDIGRQTPASKTKIACEARDCAYNDCGCCQSENVHVCGDGACKCGETCCDTFRRK